MQQEVYVYFQCEDCDKCWGEGEAYQDAPNIRAKARRHSKATGHLVTGQICYAIVYGNEKNGHEKEVSRETGEVSPVKTTI